MFNDKTELDNLINNIDTINSFEELKQIKSRILKSKYISSLKSKLRDSSSNIEKKSIGMQLNEINSKVASLIQKRTSFIRDSQVLDDYKYNIFNYSKKISLPMKKGFLHPLTIVNNKIKKYLNGLGFYFSYGIEIEEEKFNFEILNIPKNHQARTMHDTFYLNKNRVLRTHATNMTARHLQEESKSKKLGEIKMHYSIGSVYRNDDNDSTHSFQFNQADIFSIGENLSFANLKYIINNLLKVIFGKSIDIRYRISYFPFTEPSFEVDIKRKNDSSWIEILGCGMINNKVLTNTNHDPKKIVGIAAGIGVERLAMILWNIKDIRDLYLNDYSFNSKIN